MQLFIKIISEKANSVDPDQTAPSGAVWSGSALFAPAILLVTLVYEILGHLPNPNFRICIVRGLGNQILRINTHINRMQCTSTALMPYMNIECQDQPVLLQFDQGLLFFVVMFFSIFWFWKQAVKTLHKIFNLCPVEPGYALSLQTV